MSLILDALNRARDDVNPVPGLATHHRVELVAANRRQYLLWVALSVAVVMIAWLIVERYSAPRSTGDEVVARVTQVIVEPAPAVAGSASPAPQSQDLPAAAVSMARLQAQEQLQVDSVATAPPSAVIAVAVPAQPVSVPVTEPVSAPALEPEPVPEPLSATEYVAVSAQAQAESPEQNDAVAQLYSNPPPTEEPVTQRDTRSAARQNNAGAESAGSSREQTIDIDRVLREAREEVANASLPDHPVPFLVDLSQQTKDSIPTVYYLRHDYSSNASLSTVVLNSKTLGVGGSPVPGMKIEEILPDSVVLNYQGTQFRLRALNSWVNL
jgi:hypothetical protein